MSLYNGTAEFGLQELLARRLTTPGGLPAAALAPELFGMLTLESDRPEWGYLKSERLCAAAGNVAAVAAQNSACALANPAGSGVIATVQRIGVTPAATTVQILLTQLALALPVVTGAVRDARWVPAGSTSARPVCTTSHGTQALLPGDAVIARLGGSQSNVYEEPIIVPPGWQLLVYGSTVNIAFTCWDLSWTERRAQPGELV